jgi:hypothetical protein
MDQRGKTPDRQKKKKKKNPDRYKKYSVFLNANTGCGAHPAPTQW